MTFALEGMRALEITQVMSGPFCGRRWAARGADVTKAARRPDDESHRMVPPPARGESAPFLGITRNKRGIAIGLKTDQGKEVFRLLAARADVLVEHFRPGTMDGL